MGSKLGAGSSQSMPRETVDAVAPCCFIPYIYIALYTTDISVHLLSHRVCLKLLRPLALCLQRRVRLCASQQFPCMVNNLILIEHGAIYKYSALCVHAIECETLSPRLCVTAYTPRTYTQSLPHEISLYCRLGKACFSICSRSSRIGIFFASLPPQSSYVIF